MSKNYFLAIATLMGTIIGVGLFALPYITNQSGVLPLVVFMISLAFVQYYLQMLFAEAVLCTKKAHRLPGLMGEYSGETGRKLTFLVEIIGLCGSILAYIIVGGIFLHQLLNLYFGGSEFLYSTILFIAVSVITFYEIKLIAGMELVLTLLMILAVGLIAWKGFGLIDVNNFRLIDWPNAVLPYGPIFFAVTGGAAIPEICKLLAGNKEKIRSAIAWGTFASAALMIAFVLIILGITGKNTTPDTLTGLAGVLPVGVVTVGLIFGLLAIITSYIVFAQAAEEIYQWDLGFKNKTAWLLAAAVPYLLYLIGWNDLISVIGFTGAVCGGLSGIILIWLIFKIKARPQKDPGLKNKITKFLAYILSILLILGIIYEVFNLI